MWWRPKFLVWLLVLATLCVFANWPRDSGSLKPFRWAGYPWTFAFWNAGRVEWFSLRALVADMAVGVAVSVSIAWLCSRSRYSIRRRCASLADPDIAEREDNPNEHSTFSCENGSVSH
jgi:hypothetical protein